MPIANYTNGFSDGVLIRGVPLAPAHGAKVFYVGNNSSLLVGEKGASNGNKGGFLSPFSTIAYALTQCVTARGDIIFVRPGHALTLTGTSDLDINIANVSIIGLGMGAQRPTVTVGTAATATLTVSGASVALVNFLVVSALDGLNTAMTVTGADFYGDLEHQDTSSAVEADIAITVSGDKPYIKIKDRGFTAGDQRESVISASGCDHSRFIVDAYGKYATSAVDIVVACVDLNVEGYIYNTSSSAGNKLVVDTATGSTWYANVEDGQAGARFSGGSGSTLASDDVSSVSSTLLVPGADATSNVDVSDVVGNKTDAAVTAVGTTKSVEAYVKGLVTMNTVQTADATSNAFAGDVVGNKTDAAVTAVGTTKSIEAYVKGLVTMATVQSADSTNNAFAGDVTGNKTDAAVYAGGTTKSVLAYSKGQTNVQESVVTTTAAVIAAGTATIFTVAGGPIEVVNIISVCVTANDGTATLLKYTADPTDGTATDLCAASASLASLAAGNVVNITGTLANAAVITTNGVAISQLGKVVVPAGVIQSITSGGATTGTWTHHLRYRPLSRGVTVT